MNPSQILALVRSLSPERLCALGCDLTEICGHEAADDAWLAVALAGRSPQHAAAVAAALEKATADDSAVTESLDPEAMERIALALSSLPRAVHPCAVDHGRVMRARDFSPWDCGGPRYCFPCEVQACVLRALATTDELPAPWISQRGVQVTTADIEAAATLVMRWRA